MMRKPVAVSEWMALSLVSLLSIAHIILFGPGGWDHSFLATILGFCFIAAFLFNQKYYPYLLFVWTFLQLVVIKTGENSEYNFAQGISFWAGIRLGENGSINIGVPAILYLLLAIRVKMDSIRGKKIRLKPFRNDPMMNEFLPADAVILKRMNVGEETSWYLIQFEGTEKPFCALIRGVDKYLVHTGKNQVVDFWKIEDPEWTLKSGKLERKLLRKPGRVIVE